MDSLPNECLLQIIGNLGFHDLLTCQQVSRRMRALSIQALRRVCLLNLVVQGVGEEYNHSNETRNKKRKCTSLVTRTVNEHRISHFGLQHMKAMDAVFVHYKVHYQLVREFRHSDLERELQQMWRSVFLLLRHCDTKNTQLELKVLDIGGVAAKQLRAVAATPEIFVQSLTLSTDLAQFVKVLRGTLSNRCQYPAYQRGFTKRWAEDLPPNHNISTWPAWDVFHQGHLAECFLKSTGVGSEPKWTVNKLVNLIQKWQNGAGLRMLFFEGYEYERGENETNDDAFFTETLKVLESSADDRFQYSTHVSNFHSRLPLDARTLVKVCSIKIDNTMSQTGLEVSIVYKYRQVPCMVTRSIVRQHPIDISSVVVFAVQLEQTCLTD